jgi:hypothetical protein
LRALLILAFALLSVDPAWAQGPIGVRAQGLAGAFVGVADDATAVYWNPSGLATGAFVSFVVDYSRLEAKYEAPDRPQTSLFTGLSAPPVGVAYYRMPSYAVRTSEAAVSASGSREEVGRSVRAVAVSTLALAALQSIGEYVVVGSTVKLVHGERGGFSESTGDVDISAMAAYGKVRLGAVVRNLTTPAFSLDGAPSEAVELQREARVGVGWGSGWRGASRVIAAFDADVMRRPTPSGDRRDIAGGVETWWHGQSIGIRGGVRRSTVGEARGVVAGGISASLMKGMFVEGHVARGSRDDQSWSVGVRVAF